MLKFNGRIAPRRFLVGNSVWVRFGDFKVRTERVPTTPTLGEKWLQHLPVPSGVTRPFARSLYRKALLDLSR
jgi:hypothetical protein